MIEHELTQHQIRRGRAETLTVQFYDDGVAVDPGTVTIGITDDAGAVVVAPETATDGSGADTRSYDLAAQSGLTRLTVTWTSDSYGDFTDSIEVVGEFLFTIREARTFDGAALESDTDYPTADIQETRARITDAFHHAMAVSHIPRYRRIQITGSGESLLFLPDLYVTTVQSIEYRDIGDTDWTALDQSDVDAVAILSGGMIAQGNSQRWQANRQYRIAYEHGYATPPLEIKRAALRLLVSYVGATRSSWDPRATSERTEFGVISLATPGRSGSTFGLPEVDAVIDRYSEHIPGIA